MRRQSPETGVFLYLKYLTVKQMARVIITQTRSMIKRPETQQRTVQSLGLGKVNKSVEVEYTPQIEGMVKKVSHLVSVKAL